MRRFRFSSWKFMLMMFVLITICFYDLGFYEEEQQENPNKKTTISSGTPEENETEAMEEP